MFTSRDGPAIREVLPADAANLRTTSSWRAGDEGGDRVNTPRDRAEQKRAEKLAVVRDQVESGSLLIRKMTDEERRRYPPRPGRPRQFGKR